MGSFVQDTLGAFGIGQTSGEENAAAQAAIQKEMFDRLDAIGIPSIEAQKLLIESPQLLKELVPELEGYVDQLQQTALKNIKTDSNIKQAQLSAINKLQSQVDAGGLTDVDKSEIEELNRLANRARESKTQGILQNLAERGQLDPFKERLLKKQAAQDAQQTIAMQTQATEDMRKQQQLNAAKMLSEIAGSQSNQEFEEKSNAAKAADLINQYNLSQRANVKERDIARTNDSRLYNLQQRQNVADQRVLAKNQEEIANKALIQQQFQNEFNKQKGVVGAGQSVAERMGQTAANQGAALGQQYGALGNATATIIKDQKTNNQNKISTKE